MKKVLMGFVLTTMLVACKPEPFEEIGPTYDLKTGIEGTWQVSNVEVIDMTRPVPESRDISDFFTQSGSMLQLRFNTADNSYEVVDPSVPGNYFGSSGSYELLGGEFPEELQLITADNDTMMLGLLNMVRSIDTEMGFRLDRGGCTDAYTAYEFTFKRN